MCFIQGNTITTYSEYSSTSTTYNNARTYCMLLFFRIILKLLRLGLDPVCTANSAAAVVLAEGAASAANVH